MLLVGICATELEELDEEAELPAPAELELLELLEDDELDLDEEDELELLEELEAKVVTLIAVVLALARLPLLGQGKSASC